jgi:hypothetical protein
MQRYSLSVATVLDAGGNRAAIDALLGGSASRKPMQVFRPRPIRPTQLLAVSWPSRSAARTRRPFWRASFLSTNQTGQRRNLDAGNSRREKSDDRFGRNGCQRRGMGLWPQRRCVRSPRGRRSARSNLPRGAAIAINGGVRVARAGGPVSTTRLGWRPDWNWNSVRLQSPDPRLSDALVVTALQVGRGASNPG